MYNIESLEHGIEQAKKHIVSLETAIEKERQMIKEYRIFIDDIENAEAAKKMKNTEVKVL